ncbi:MAG: hypothetical protein QW735_03080 [archaeon]
MRKFLMFLALLYSCFCSITVEWPSGQVFKTDVYSIIGQVYFEKACFGKQELYLDSELIETVNLDAKEGSFTSLDSIFHPIKANIGKHILKITGDCFEIEKEFEVVDAPVIIDLKTDKVCVGEPFEISAYFFDGEKKLAKIILESDEFVGKVTYSFKTKGEKKVRLEGAGKTLEKKIFVGDILNLELKSLNATPGKEINVNFDVFDENGRKVNAELILESFGKRGKEIKVPEDALGSYEISVYANYYGCFGEKKINVSIGEIAKEFDIRLNKDVFSLGDDLIVSYILKNQRGEDIKKSPLLFIDGEKINSNFIKIDQRFSPGKHVVLGVFGEKVSEKSFQVMKKEELKVSEKRFGNMEKIEIENRGNYDFENLVLNVSSEKGKEIKSFSLRRGEKVSFVLDAYGKTNISLKDDKGKEYFGKITGGFTQLDDWQMSVIFLIILTIIWYFFAIERKIGL